MICNPSLSATAHHAAECSFCTECIRRLASSGEVTSCLGATTSVHVKGSQLEDPVAMAAVGRRQLERLKFEAVKYKMRSQVGDEVCTSTCKVCTPVLPFVCVNLGEGGEL